MNERSKLIAQIAGQIFAADRGAVIALNGAGITTPADWSDEDDAIDHSLNLAVRIVDLAEDHEDRQLPLPDC